MWLGSIKLFTVDLLCSICFSAFVYFKLAWMDITGLHLIQKNVLYLVMCYVTLSQNALQRTAKFLFQTHYLRVTCNLYCCQILSPEIVLTTAVLPTVLALFTGPSAIAHSSAVALLTTATLLTAIAIVTIAMPCNGYA